MGIQLIEQARLAGVEKFVTIGTVCATRTSRPFPSRKTISGTVNRRGNERTVRPGEADALGAGTGLPPAVRVQCDLPAAVNPVRPGITSTRAALM